MKQELSSISSSQKSQSKVDKDQCPRDPETAKPASGSHQKVQSLDIPQFELTVGQMGENLTVELAKLIANDAFDGKISIPGLGEIDWAKLTKEVEPPTDPKDREQTEVQYASGSTKGVTRLTLSGNNVFKFPDFSVKPELPPVDPRSFLSQMINTPPNGAIPYYVGPPLCGVTAAFDSLLHPGSHLSEVYPSAKGISSPYHHAGEMLSGTAFHREDGNMRSCNLTLYGRKLFMLIWKDHSAKFEAFIRTHFGQKECDQAIRHHSVLISPERLQEEGIGFSIHIAGPGEMIVTAPGQYHAVVNLTRCFAISINFLLPGEELRYEGLDLCGFQGAADQGADAQVAAESRGADAQVAAESQRGKRHLEVESESESESDLPTAKKPKVELTQLLADNVTGKQAIFRFFDLVLASRSCDAPSKSELKKSQTDIQGTDELKKARALHELNRFFGGKSNITMFYHLLSQIAFAETVDDMTKRSDRLLAGGDQLAQLLLHMGQKVTVESRKRLQNELSSPRKWIQIIGPYDGIQCFLPFGGQKREVTVRQCLGLNQGDIATFHDFLRMKPFLKELCEIGREFQASIWSCKEFPTHQWESQAIDRETVSIEELVKLLKPLL
ncbi:JmjC domain, hydroxylase-domain-containing protein [Podospora didyma]|uniref:JmjC domain, hydroxylase-domain-containing protein n=1 Tax=Podospora didyma TaxID=330526 RepID=A0AAE0NBT0_9PEZI|nr:JmjC domain, hydroxylase-domain-containing protein [Podospora didyma]